MSKLLTFLHIAGLILFVYLFCSISYLLVIAIAGMLYRENLPPPASRFARIAILIPVFKDDHVIEHTVSEALNHDYHEGLFDVIVIADSLKHSTIAKLRQMGATVLEVAAGMKARSIHAALSVLPDDKYSLVMILDADNIMKPDCLNLVNDYYQAGHLAIQCHRTAKNEQNPVARLDAISEEINNHLFRLGPQALGFSAAPCGSGMAFEIGLIRSIFDYPGILDNPGEDREIDMQLLKRGIRMHYIPDAWVLDEKVASHDVFQKQRVRWLEAQWYHLRRFLEPDMRGIKINRQYVNKLVQNLLLPRSLYMVVFSGIIVLLILRYATGKHFMFPIAGWWLSLLLFFVLTLCMAMPSRFFSSATIRALLALPLLIVSMLRAVFSMQRSRKEFLHTPKSYTSTANHEE